MATALRRRYSRYRLVSSSAEQRACTASIARLAYALFVATHRNACYPDKGAIAGTDWTCIHCGALCSRPSGTSTADARETVPPDLETSKPDFGVPRVRDYFRYLTTLAWGLCQETNASLSVGCHQGVDYQASSSKPQALLVGYRLDHQRRIIARKTGSFGHCGSRFH